MKLVSGDADIVSKYSYALTLFGDDFIDLL